MSLSMRDKLLAILRGYENCDFDRLESIANHLGVTVDFLMHGYLSGEEVTEDDIEAVTAAISATKDNLLPITIGDNFVHMLKSTKPPCAEEDETTKLPRDIFNILGELVSIYSAHRKTKTVYFKNGSLRICPEDAFPDSGKDTYEENGIVAQRYHSLLSAIVAIARNSSNDCSWFGILGLLYRTITSLSEDACNQQNAVDIARVLFQYQPDL